MQRGFARRTVRGVLDPVPLSLIQSGSDLTEPRLRSTDAVVTWVQRWGRHAAIVGRHIDGGPVREYTHGPPPAPGRGTSGGCYAWTSDEAHLVYVAASGGVRWQPIDGGPGRFLTCEGDPCRAPMLDSKDRFVVYVVDEARVMLTTVDGVDTERLDDGRHEFCFDPSVSPDGTTVSWMGWSPPDMPWDGSVRVDRSLVDGSITVTGHADAAVQQPRFAPDGAATHVGDGTGWLNVHIGGIPVVAESFEHAGPTWGMGQRSYDLSPDGRSVAFTRNEGGFASLQVVERSTGEVRRLGRGVHGHLVWGDLGNGDDEALVALRSGARTPTQIVAYRDVRQPSESGAAAGTDDVRDVERTVVAIGPNVSWRVESLPEPELVEVPSRDGRLALHARRYVAGGGRLLCWVHGGPTDQWQVDWRPRFTYWSSRGWDVLAVDPRGTTGHGRVYQQALHGGWGRLDVDDTADLIAHAHAAGWATPEHTVMMGGSSGGLTVLGVLADHPDLVAAGVASYPVSDLKALTEVTHRFEAHYTDTLVAPLDGSAASEQRFVDLSPIHRADRIASPLLLMHGTDDPVVPIEQSRRLVETITASMTGADVEYVEYEGEGHGFRDPDNVADEYARTEAFLARFA